MTAGEAIPRVEDAPRSARHLPLAGVRAVVELVAGVVAATRIAVTGVAGRAFRAREAEAALTGREPVGTVLDAAAARVRAAVPRPLEDIHASGPFRLHLAEVLTRRVLGLARERAKGERAGDTTRVGSAP